MIANMSLSSIMILKGKKKVCEVTGKFALDFKEVLFYYITEYGKIGIDSNDITRSGPRALQVSRVICPNFYRPGPMILIFYVIKSFKFYTTHINTCCV